MSDLNEIIKRLLGEIATKRQADDSKQYIKAFEKSGVSKATDIITALKKENMALSRLAYFSIGGSTGAEILHVMKNTSIKYGVLLEYDNVAAKIAENNSKKQALKQKKLEVIRGDATQMITTCKEIMVRWRKENKIDGIVCSIQSVLHELPTRSPKYIPHHLLGEAFWDWDPCFFFCREPCASQTWPEEVNLSVSDISSQLLSALAEHIKTKHSMSGNITRSGTNNILLHKDVAVELLFKIFYIDDYLYEIEERVTSIDPITLEKVVHGVFTNGDVDCQYLNSNSFKRLYREHNVIAKDLNESQLSLPLTFVSIFGRRNTKKLPSNPKKSSSQSGVVHNKTGYDSVKKQEEHILNLSLLPWCQRRSQSLRVLWPEMLVDPELASHKNSTSVRRLTEWVNHFQWGANVALVGAPGAGKSTGLRRLFLDISENIQKSSSPYPIFGHIDDYVQYINNSSIDSPLSKAITIARQSKKVVIHFVDGLDEKDVTLTNIFFSNFIPQIPKDEFVWCACRAEYFFNLLGTHMYYTQYFRDVLEFCPWQEPDTRWFINKYAERLNLPKLPKRYDSLLDSAPEALEFSKNPFQLTLILYLLQGDLKAEMTLNNAYALYNSFYDHWLQRETHRKTSNATEGVVRTFHILIAEKLFDNRGNIGGRKILLDEQMKSMIKNNTAAADLLRIEGTPGSIIAFRHETIAEYLLAHRIFEYLTDPKSELNEVFLRTYTFEINRFVREAINLLDDNDKENLVELLSNRYMKYFKGEDTNIQKSKQESVDELRTREQILYYIGRIPCSTIPETLKTAYYNERHRILVRIAALGSILHGDEEIESDYISKLIPNSECDIENRSIQLVYFGDAHGDFYTFRDNGRYTWDRTRDATLRRILSNNIRDQRLRWWDLRTFKLFTLSRQKPCKFDTEAIEAIRGVTVDSSSSNNRIQQIKKEIEELLSTITLRQSK